MLRLDYPEYENNKMSIMDVLLPAKALDLPPNLSRAEEILMDEKLERPFFDNFNTVIGRGGVPVRPYIRLIALRHINSWSYGTLEKEVNRNVMLKKFCRIPFQEPVPHSSTLIKLNKKYEKLNPPIIKRLIEEKIIHSQK